MKRLRHALATHFLATPFLANLQEVWQSPLFELVTKASRDVDSKQSTPEVRHYHSETLDLCALLIGGGVTPRDPLCDFEVSLENRAGDVCAIKKKKMSHNHKALHT